MLIPLLMSVVIAQDPPAPVRTPVPAARQDQTCSISSLRSVHVRSDAARAMMVRSGGACRVFTAPPGSAEAIDIVLNFDRPVLSLTVDGVAVDNSPADPATADGGVSLPPEPAPTISSDRYSATFPTRVQNGVQQNLRYGAVLEGDAAPIDVPITVSYAPSINIQPGDGCAAFQICIVRGTETRVPLTIEHAHRIRENSARLYKSGGASYQLELSRDAAFPTVIIPAEPAVADGDGYTLELRLAGESLIGGAATDLVTLSDIRVMSRAKPAQSVTIRIRDSDRDVFYVGEFVPVALSDTSLPAGSHDLKQENGGQVIGSLFVAEPGAGTIHLTSATTAGQGRFPTAVAVGASYKTTLRAMARPGVDSVRVTSGAEYNDGKLRTGLKARVAVFGTNASVFMPQVPVGTATLDTLPPDPHLPNLRVFNITLVEGGPSQTLPVTLSAGTDIRHVVEVPIAEHQRVRPLDFVSVRHNQRRGCLFAKPQVTKLESTHEIGACGFGGAALVFEPNDVDNGSRYGPQYLKIHAQFRDENGKMQKEETINWVVAPPGYTVSGDYRTGDVLPFDEIFEAFGRYATPGSTVTVGISHDPARYQQATGVRRVVTMRDRRRIAIVGNLGVTPFMIYSARIDRDNAQRSHVANGTPADSLVRVRTTRDWETDVASVSFNASIDAYFVYADGRRSPFGARVGAIVMQSPYGDDTRVGLQAAVPIQTFKITGELDFSLAAGAVFMKGGRWFPTLSTIIQLSKES